MPPRISEFPCLRALSSALPSTNCRQGAWTLRTFSASRSHQAKSKGEHRYRDPYVAAQARARKAANISKQEALKLNRARALGDPVRGLETEFVRSFDTASEHDTAGGEEKDQPRLNYSLTQHEIDTQLTKSKALVEPAPLSKHELEHVRDVNKSRILRKHEQNMEQWAAAHETVKEAVKRITNLESGNSKDRFRINVERCIRTFGRHETDKYLPHRTSSVPLGPGGLPLSDHEPAPLPLKKRLGPDTGSPEVQIAILTARIRNLANHLDRVGSSRDKVNKRNLRLLVHKRQKLLLYLRRKERAGPRWQRCIEMLGLTEGTWKGEISL
ncbi:ribosomal protein S15 [Verruconis gallopava]|uniref:Ribosomal protein S15 n=1 Tax=Verruconis gallopava TaxID=253628 RepID=A0A0D2BBE9_9PEZI|nr:ribosomal protein S15 [Verruconis gallopava]KIW08639.1 ribosomal protein S15 [Verruconis gallopava]